MSGIPAKTMVGVTALSEGTVCFVSVLIWFYLLEHGTGVDFVLLSSMILGSMFSIILAPLLVRILPEGLFRKFIPIYCGIMGVYSVGKIIIGYF